MKNITIKFLFAVITINLFLSTNLLAQTITEMEGERGTVRFGTHVVTLPNGNIVVTDPDYGIPGGAMKVGAVYLYNGTTKRIISKLTGSNANDRVGLGGIKVLTNGNYVIGSTNWSSDGTGGHGAATFAHMDRGISGIVSEENSLIGSRNGDGTGYAPSITALTNGNYVVRSYGWDNGAIVDAGAITWGNGETGIVGRITPENSLVGTHNHDYLGLEPVIALNNGNYVANNRLWSLDSHNIRVGAVTWGNGETGTTGAVSAANSLIGSKRYDEFGSGGITPLSNGNYVAGSRQWDNGSIVDAGAIAWGNGSTGTTGVVSASNSLVGTTANENLHTVTALRNGNYIVRNSSWDNGQIQNVGAVTLVNGRNGMTGTMTASNSLIGSTANDYVGNGGVTELTNGNYVVISPNWDNVATRDVGAITWVSGRTGTNGTVSASNSLVGSTAFDSLGSKSRIRNPRGAGRFYGVVALTNGNYVVNSPFWDNGDITNVGAVTLVNGSRAFSGNVSASNSLTGSSEYDYVGIGGTTALTNGNYVVSSYYRNNGQVRYAGAATFRSGENTLGDVVSATNSLVGTRERDYVGIAITALINGNYVVSSPSWGNGQTREVGAATIGDGENGTTGEISASNSLIGSTSGDFSGLEIKPLNTGNFVVKNRSWSNGEERSAGAVSYMNGAPRHTADLGAISERNSLMGKSSGGGNYQAYSLNDKNNELVVSNPFENKITFIGKFPPPPPSAEIGGKVRRSNTDGIANVVVTVTDKFGQIRTTRTNEKGDYFIDHIKTRQSYTISANADGHLFRSRVIRVDETRKGIDIESNR